MMRYLVFCFVLSGTLSFAAADERRPTQIKVAEQREYSCELVDGSQAIIWVDSKCHITIMYNGTTTFIDEGNLAQNITAVVQLLPLAEKAELVSKIITNEQKK